MPEQLHVDVMMHTANCAYKRGRACNCNGSGPYFRMKKAHWLEFSRLCDDAFNKHGEGLFQVVLYADTATFDQPEWLPTNKAQDFIHIFPSK